MSFRCKVGEKHRKQIDSWHLKLISTFVSFKKNSNEIATTEIKQKYSFRLKFDL